MEKNKEKIKDFLQINGNEGATCPTLWKTMTIVLRGKFIAQSSSKKKLERAYTSNLTAHLRALEQKERNTPNRNRCHEINSGMKSTKYEQ